MMSRTVFIILLGLAASRVLALVVPLGVESAGLQPKPVLLSFDVRRGSKRARETISKAKFVSRDMQEEEDEDDAAEDHDCRDPNKSASKQVASVKMGDSETYFVLTLAIGSNKDKSTVLVDTGSSDLVIMDKQVQCDASVNCLKNGAYDHTTSSSFQPSDLLHDESLNASYGDGSYMRGIWATDTVSFDSTDGSLAIQNVTFGLSQEAKSDMGILGISTPGRESSTTKYPNFPLMLKQQKIINKVAYSLYINSDQSGTILFGGIDRAKYEGPLATLDQVGQELSVKLNSVSFGDQREFLGAHQPVLIDSGSTYSLVPQNVARMVAEAIGGHFSEAHGGYIIDCNQSADKVVEFNFDGVSIKVPLTDLVVEADNDPQKRCGLALVPSYDEYGYILGENFLQRAYVSFNLEDQVISIAQLKYTDDSDIIAL